MLGIGALILAATIASASNTLTVIENCEELNHYDASGPYILLTCPGKLYTYDRKSSALHEIDLGNVESKFGCRGKKWPNRNEIQREVCWNELNSVYDFAIGTGVFVRKNVFLQYPT